MQSIRPQPGDWISVSNHPILLKTSVHTAIGTVVRYHKNSRRIMVKFDHLQTPLILDLAVGRCIIRRNKGSRHPINAA